MTQGPIENPIINSPFAEPARHFVTSPQGQVTMAAMYPYYLLAD